MKKLVVFFLLLSYSLLFSQSDKQIYSIGGNVIVKGRVTCELTGEPVETELEFRASNGKKIRTKSNSITGNWEQVLPSDNYKVILHSWNIARKTYDMQVQPSEKYKEIQQNFTVKRLLPTDIYLQSPLFKNNSAELSADFSQIAGEIKEVLKYNRAVEFTFYVSASDMNKPSETKVNAVDNTQNNTKSSKKTAKKQQPAQTYRYLLLMCASLQKQLPSHWMRCVNPSLPDALLRSIANRWYRQPCRFQIQLFSFYISFSYLLSKV